MTILPPRQMALALHLPESHAADDFMVGACNETAHAAIVSWPHWPQPVMALVGPDGSGKSHLGSIWAEASGARRLSARDIGGVAPLDALATGALLLEDVTSDISQKSLFHLLNLTKEHGAFLLMTAKTSPATWEIALNDLASRLRAVPAIAIGQPDDVLLRAVMVKLFTDRQIAVDVDVVEFLARRIERSLATVRRIVERLDHESLERGRRVTRALAAEVLERL